MKRQAGLLACLLVLAVAGTGSGVGAATSAPPTDYKRVQGLSQPVYETQKESFMVPMDDGIKLYVEVTRPKADGQFPVILELSPYHGTLADRDGTRILPYPKVAGKSIGLTGYFAPRGYAVAMADLRGTGRSQGCLDHLGPNDAKDAKALIAWLVAQPWSNGRIGMTGHSYVGSTPMLTAAQHPPGLVTIVPSSGLASMYDHQFQGGVPYYLQWAGPQWAYEQLAMNRYLPPGFSDPLGGPWGDNFGNDPQYFGCGWTQSALTGGDGQVSGQYNSWDAARDWRTEATKADIPIFLIHSVNDNAARVPAMQWFTDRGGHAGDKIWLGQWNHSVGEMSARQMQWTLALNAWFDHWLQQRTWTDATGVVHEIDTGPPVEVFLSNAEDLDTAQGGDRAQIFTADTWPPPATTSDVYTEPDGSLGTAAPASAGSASFSGDASGWNDSQTDSALEFVAPPATADTLYVGVPKLDLVASVTQQHVDLIVNLYDQSPDGERRRITQCALNPQLRDGLTTVSPVIPEMTYTMHPPCFTMAHNLRAGHQLVLRVTTSDPDKAPTFSFDPHVTVVTGSGGTVIHLPAIDTPVLYPDTFSIK